MTAKYSVYVVDDEAAIRKSATFMLRTSGYTVETFESGPAFLAAVPRLEPGCILLDVRMPEMDGLEVQERLNERGVIMPVIVLTGHGDVAVAVQAMKAGASDFIEKPYEKQHLLKSIEAARARIESAARADLQEQEARKRLNALTARELDVLRGLVGGLPNKTIGYDLGISPRTVEIHRANLMEKLGARSLSDALRIGFNAGLGKEPPATSGA
jgi:two-component system, LuxR family, response regulator FixJ